MAPLPAAQGLAPGRCGQMTTMIEPLRRAVRIASQQVAVRCGRSQLTYAQTWERARRLAGALGELGLGRGGRVAVAGRNCHRYLELYQAVPAAGMVIVPLLRMR